MEIAIINETSVKVKGKLASFVVDPTASRAKIVADAAILLKGNGSELPEIEGCRLAMYGPGEYEVGGVKITGIKVGESTSYYLTIDGVSLLISSTASFKGKESLRDVDIAVLLADTVVEPSALAGAASGAAVFYGPHASENIKALGKEATAVEKYTVTKEKLPAEMEAILLS